MKMRFKKYYIRVYSRRLLRILGQMIGLGTEAMGCGHWPFIVIRSDIEHLPVHDELVRHEEIHLRQQLELLIVGAWILYLFEYAYARFVKKLDKRQSYYYTSFEQEAHRNAMNPEYLLTRRPYAFVKYIKDKKWLGRNVDGSLIEKKYG